MVCAVADAAHGRCRRSRARPELRTRRRGRGRRARCPRLLSRQPAEHPDGTVDSGDARRRHATGRTSGWLVMYDSYMTDVAVSEARQHLADLIESTHRSGEPVYVTRRGRRVAVLLDSDQYERIIDELEDTLDRAALRAARED